MIDLSNELESFKLRSRRYRNKALTALEDHDEITAKHEFAKARDAITDAITYLQKLGVPSLDSGERADEGEIAIAQELADCFGILGGIYRAQGDYNRAKDEYDKGYKYESCKRFNILNTYNRVNRLVIRILRNPELLSMPSILVDIPEHKQKMMPELLRETGEEIERQLREGRQDRSWALADLVMVRLLGGQDGVDIALQALDDSSANDPFPYHSMLKVIREITRRHLPMQDKLIVIGEHLRQKLPKNMQGEPLRPDH